MIIGGMTQKDLDDQQSSTEKQAKKKDLLARMDEIDRKSIRAMRAERLGNATSEDLQKLADCEVELTDLRKKYNEIA